MKHSLLYTMLLCSAAPAAAQISVSIGINVPTYPTLQRVPGYPVYYAPRLNSNYFFYDGMYWVYENDNWYGSSWYNGPWAAVDRFDVPVYLLRVPVRYYRHAPSYFVGWRADAAPRWGDHWGHSWEQRRSGWNEWNRSSAPAPAPLPAYQRQYSGERYPQPAQQAVIQTRSYTYQPADVVARQHYQYQRTQAQAAPATTQQRVAPQPQQQAAPQPQQPPRAPSQQQRPPQQQAERHQQPPPALEQRPPWPQTQPQERADQGQGQDKGQGQGQDRGKGHEKDDKDNKDKGQGKGHGG